LVGLNRERIEFKAASAVFALWQLGE